MRKIYLILLVSFCSINMFGQACPSQPLYYPCDASGNPTYTSYDLANIQIQQDTINAILRRIIKQAPLSVTACPALPLNYPCDGSGNPTYTVYDDAMIWVQQDTTIALLRKLLAGGGGGGGGKVSIKDSAWLLTGNTITSSQYIGSNNAMPMKYYTDGAISGYTDYNASLGNTYWGALAGNVGTATGTNNTGTGLWALKVNTSGSNNIATGYASCYMNTSGSNNIAIGYEALFYNTSGQYSIAIGNSTVESTGGYNIGIGQAALGSGGTYQGCLAIGYNALMMNSASSNIALGLNCMDNNTTGTTNIAIGNAALFHNTSGSSNFAAGNYSLFNNNFSFCTAVGDTTGLNNSGNLNSYYGYNAHAGVGLTITNSTAIGANSVVKGSNSIGFGDANVDSLCTYGMICINNPQQTISGSTAGTAICSEPLGGTDNKKVVMYLSGFQGTGTYTYPIAYLHTPFAVGGGVGVSLSTISSTSFSFSYALPTTGFIVLEGF